MPNAAAIARCTVVAPHREGGQAQFIDRPIAVPDSASSLSATCTWALERLHEPLDLARLRITPHVQPPVPLVLLIAGDAKPADILNVPDSAI